MELEEFSKYLNEEVIKNYSDIIFEQDISKIYSIMVEKVSRCVKKLKRYIEKLEPIWYNLYM